MENITFNNISISSAELGQISRAVKGMPARLQLMEGSAILIINTQEDSFQIAEKTGAWWLSSPGPASDVIDRVLRELRAYLESQDLMPRTMEQRDQLVVKALETVLKLKNARY